MATFKSENKGSHFLFEIEGAGLTAGVARSICEKLPETEQVVIFDLRKLAPSEAQIVGVLVKGERNGHRIALILSEENQEWIREVLADVAPERQFPVFPSEEDALNTFVSA